MFPAQYGPIVMREQQHVSASGREAPVALPEVLVEEIRRVRRHSQELRARSVILRSKTDERLLETSGALARSLRLSQAHQRSFTKAPPGRPPEPHCPDCGRLLRYEQSYVSGVSEKHAEQWDHFTCPTGCGRFQYRQRTLRLTKRGARS